MQINFNLATAIFLNLYMIFIYLYIHMFVYITSYNKHLIQLFEL